MTANLPSVTGPRPLTEGERTAAAATAAAVGVLGLLGFVISFGTVARAAEPSFHALSFLVPLGVDLGIAVFSALDIVLARLDMRVRWLRFIPWTLTAATVYLNVASQTTLFGKVSHAVLPLLWVVAVEVGAHVMRKRAGLANPTRMERIRASRWLLAFPSTFALWRRMVLWEIRSYPGALTRERDRILAKTDLQDRYGMWWKFKATRRERALYRLGELAPEGTAPVRLPSAGRPALPHAAADPASSLAPVGRNAPNRKTRSRAARHRRTAATPADVDDLMPLGWRIAADHKSSGVTLTRDRLRDAVRAAGQSISTDRAGALLARLRTETPPRESAWRDARPRRAERGGPTAATEADGPRGRTADRNRTDRRDETRSDRASSPTKPARETAPPAKKTDTSRDSARSKAYEVQAS